MEPFKAIGGLAAPLPAANIDTDVIMPKKYLKGVDRAGLREGVFRNLRFDDEGRLDDGFILNRPGWKDALFLVVGPNFGCGSSREHAVWGLRQLGIRALIGTSYAGIFFDNCARNGLLAISLSPEQMPGLFALAGDPERNRMLIDLAAQRIETDEGALAFAMDPLLKAMLLEGLDSVGMTLRDRARIESFERTYLRMNPWLRPGQRGATAQP